MTTADRMPERTRNDALEMALDQVARPLRGMRGLARLLIGMAGALVLAAGAAWLARAGLLTGPLPVLLLWVLGPLFCLVGLVAARQAIRRLGPWHVGALLERFGTWRLGSLTTVLDVAAPGTSTSLHVAAIARRATEVLDRAPAELAPAIQRERSVSRWAGLAMLAALLLLFAARPTTGAAMRLWAPVDAWNALTAPVRLSARSATVARGEAAVLDITAIGRRRATLFTRAPGEAWRVTEITLDAMGHAVVTTLPLAADLVARVESGGHRSPEVTVGIRLAAFLGAFTVIAHYPAYLALDPETLPTGGDTLVLPEGTRLAVTGRATTPLASARLDGPDADTLVVRGAAFQGDLVPKRSGMWRLSVMPAEGAPLQGELPTLAIRLVPDSAPVVEVPIPGIDTVAPPSMSLPLVVSARDDHGLSSLLLEVRRNRGPAITRVPLSLPPGGSDRALITAPLDLGAFGLVAGDTLRYAAVALDNAPVHHVGRSREYLVRIPTEAEQRAAREQVTGATATALDSLRNAAGRVQREAEDLARERQRGDTRTGEPRPTEDAQQKAAVPLDAVRKAEATAAEQQKVLDDATKLEHQVDELRQAAERAGLADTALARQLSDISKLLQKALTPELQAKLDSLRSALKSLDPDQMKNALQDLAKDEAQLKQALDQAQELFKRAALETDLANIADEAKQVADEQHKLTEKLAHPDSGKNAAAERALSDRADSLGAALNRAAQKVPADTTKQQLRAASQAAQAAAGQMQQAAQAAQQNQSQEAQSEGQKAASKLDPLGQQIQDARQQMQQQMRAEVIQALNRALEETSRLAQQQLGVADAFERGALVSDTRAQQGLVEEGAAKVLSQVLAVSAKNALVSPQAASALAAARQSMRSAVDAVSSASPNLRDAASEAGDAVDALAVAAFNLLTSRDKVGGSQSGSGMEEAIQQLQQMAGKQGQLAQQTGSMMQSGQVGLQQLLQLGQQQRAIAQQLERLRATGQLPGASDMAKEAKDLAQTLDAGQLTPDMATRQQKLFKRMLDAGRSLQGDEQDDSKRQSTTAKDGEISLPPALDARLRSGAGDIRLPSWESMQHLSPEERRRVVDYFRRLTGGPS